MHPTILNITFDCADAAAQATFWAAVTGWTASQEDGTPGHAEYCVQPPGGALPRLYFTTVPEPKAVSAPSSPGTSRPAPAGSSSPTPRATSSAWKAEAHRSGTEPLILVPWPAAESQRTVPPMAPSRSAMLT